MFQWTYMWYSHFLFRFGHFSVLRGDVKFKDLERAKFTWTKVGALARWFYSFQMCFSQTIPFGYIYTSWCGVSLTMVNYTCISAVYFISWMKLGRYIPLQLVHVVHFISFTIGNCHLRKWSGCAFQELWLSTQLTFQVLGVSSFSSFEETMVAVWCRAVAWVYNSWWRLKERWSQRICFTISIADDCIFYWRTVCRVKGIHVQFSFRISLVTVSTKVNQFHDFRFAVAMNLKQLEEPKLRASNALVWWKKDSWHKGVFWTVFSRVFCMRRLFEDHVFEWHVCTDTVWIEQLSEMPKRTAQRSKQQSKKRQNLKFIDHTDISNLRP